MNALDQGTRASHTARLTGQLTTRDGNTTTVLHATGELNFDQDATHIRAASSDGKSRFDLIVIGKKGYGRGTADVLLTPNWCPLDITVDIDPGAVLHSLATSHVTLDRVGDETISGVETTHYHAAHTDEGDVLDVWVDPQDRLRRMIDTSDSTTSTADLYDFGEPIPPVQAPVTGACPASDTDGDSSSFSVTPTSTAP